VRSIFALLLVAACDPAMPLPDAGPAPGTTLPTAAYYMQGTTVNCGAPSPQDCVFELGFCRDGAWAMRVGDVIESGTYALDQGQAVMESYQDVPFTFDFTTQRIVTNNPNGEPWQATTAVQDADVVCME